VFELTSELLDTFDDEGRSKGTKERKAVHREGDWHRCFHCLIVSGCDGKRHLVLQRRARHLVEYPALIDVSAAGHLRAGETVANAASREIAEELGIDLPFESLRSLGEYPLIVHTEGFWSRELTDVFVVCDDRSPNTFHYDPTEVASLITMNLAHACELWSGARARALVTEFENGRSFDHLVAVADFVNEVPDYWPWLAMALKEAFSPIET
jgi:isopentenyldiphosphate isomerase